MAVVQGNGKRAKTHTISDKYLLLVSSSHAVCEFALTLTKDKILV